ncbi:MAG: SDR family oxidoreductase [Alphaproteobacteria bacterium]|nr:SDR family oxidoreductase [Alphaproteobacteria bacterium]MBU0799350.1 SDR family oxidoreductase [Alphaproteobacteria bacterium]MBU0887692.1 SDR family oxidoreductase [Alphaproteobacteria bacterium]MBU1812881.1 SDR family oxidoreductase [Alphaproteobacteria bacterium]MBU2091710.1 SDR family oxidoreductase [Alphaproteobacteria bacterium]
MGQKVTLVTGASKGIGRAIADHLADQGHHIVAISRSAPGDGFRGDFFAADLSDAKDTADVLQRVTAQYAIDNLVNNAGLIKAQTLENASLEAFDQMIALNLRSLLQCAQAVLPAMKQKKHGRIVNLGSRAALGKESRSIYGATKAAVVGFTRTWALELAPHGITVNCIAPGPIETELFREGNPPGSPQAEKLIASIPVGRIGQPRDVAAACAYLVSDDAGFITGQVLNLCGGLSVGLTPL